MFNALRCVVRLLRAGKCGIIRHMAYLLEASLLFRLLRQDGISHLHAHFGTNSATVALLCHLLGGPGYSFTVHGPEEFDDPIGLSLEEKIRHCAFVVAISHYGRSQLMRWCPQEQWEKIKVVHCTVDDTFLTAPALPVPELPRLVCVGRLCEQKGQLLLIETLAQLDREGHAFHMTLAGDGEMRKSVEDSIARHGLQNKVTITGWISGDEVRREILASRAMVLPSFAEGLPVVIMEALALRRPVVSTYVAGIPELVRHGINGWLAPPGSMQDLLLALKEVLAATPEQLFHMGAEGARLVQAQHNAATESGKLFTLFRQAGTGDATGPSSS